MCVGWYGWQDRRRSKKYWGSSCFKKTHFSVTESMSYKSKSFEREKYHLKAIHFVILINEFYRTLQWFFDIFLMFCGLFRKHQLHKYNKYISWFFLFLIAMYFFQCLNLKSTVEKRNHEETKATLEDFSPCWSTLDLKKMYLDKWISTNSMDFDKLLFGLFWTWILQATL